MRIFRMLRAGLAVAVCLGALIAAVRLVVADDNPASVRRQLAFLRSELESGAAHDAQAMFPEGYFFLYALYGLTEVDLGLGRPPGERAGELTAARWALAALDSADGRAPFDAGLTPSYGVFYRGWTNWLRGGIVALDPSGPEAARFERDSAELAAAFDAAPTPFLAAYPGQAWPVDSTVAIASLRLYDKLFPPHADPAPGGRATPAPRYRATVDRWLAGAKERLDPATGLLPHRADVATGAPIEVARGSSQSMIQRFLVDVDPAFAAQQYRVFRERFRPWGPAIREFPTGVAGAGDVDSGPLVLGVSLSATAVTMGAARVQGDGRLADALTGLADVAGVPIDTPHARRYAFGVLPVGDAFVAWSKSARPWVSAPPAGPPPDLAWWWCLPILTVLLGIAIFSIFLSGLRAR
ncbi:hypothetical protein [Actinoplanes sp. NPDC049265]|uniref:hypothetical protein n=1 Tax=Actinoplanes sp. NPDC049265 TaxID=3363902 RepID=UPI003712A28A